MYQSKILSPKDENIFTYVSIECSPFAFQLVIYGR